MHRKVGLVATLVCLGAAACGGSADRPAPPKQDEDMPQLLQSDEVAAIMQSAARALNQEMAVAVTDRRGVILGVATNFGMDLPQYRSACVDGLPCPATDTAADSDCAVVDRAVQLARTAAFFSADQTPLTSRSVRFLSGEHFPPGIMNTAAAALFGIENTNRGCSFDTSPGRGSDVPTVPRAKNLAAVLRPDLRCENDVGMARCGCSSGIATLPGGVPIYKNGRMSGGVGVAIRGVVPGPDPVAAFDDARILRRSDANGSFTQAEFAARAFAGDNVGFPTLEPKGLRGACNEANPPACCHVASGPACVLNILPARELPFDPVIFVDGIEIPEVDPDPPVSGVGQGRSLTEPFIIDPSTTQAAVVTSQCLVGPDSKCKVFLDSATHDMPGLLTLEEAQRIIDAALAQAQITRAAIRLPLEARTAMVLAVSDIDGNLIGLFRMSDATVFSIDVAVAKSRNVIYFSSPTINPQDTMDCPGPADCRGQAFAPGTAMTNRTLSFGAQPFFPSGIDGTLPGPFRRIFIEDSAVPCTSGGQPNGPQSGIVFFPGSAPLYRNGALVGGFGVSGDGVEQDDLVTFAGTQALTSAGGNFEPPPAMRADQILVRGVRLPYLKFNRQPEQ